MKITINSKTLSAIIDRAAACTMAKAAITILESVQITAQEGKVTAYAHNPVESVVINFPAEIIEEGVACLTVSDWKKLLKADGRVTIETDGNVVKMISDKKKSSVIAVTDDMPEIPDTSDVKHIFTASSDCLMEIFKRLNPCTAKSNTRPILCGYHIYGESEDVVKFVAVDGFHMMKKTSDIKSAGKFDIVIPESVNKNFAKIAGKTDNIIVYADRKHTSFIGEDFSYIVRNIEGEPFKEDNAIPTSSAGEFHVDAAEIAKVAKDYCKTIGKAKIITNPLRLFAGESRAVLGISCNGYSTTDEVEITEESIPTSASRFPGYYAALFNAEYTADIFGNFDGNVAVKFGAPYAPVVVESDGYLGLLLPVAEKYKGDTSMTVITNNLAELAGISLAEEVA